MCPGMTVNCNCLMRGSAAIAWTSAAYIPGPPGSRGAQLLFNIVESVVGDTIQNQYNPNTKATLINKSITQ